MSTASLCWAVLNSENMTPSGKGERVATTSSMQTTSAYQVCTRARQAMHSSTRFPLKPFPKKGLCRCDQFAVSPQAASADWSPRNSYTIRRLSCLHPRKVSISSRMGHLHPPNTEWVVDRRKRKTRNPPVKIYFLTKRVKQSKIIFPTTYFFYFLCKFTKAACMGRGCYVAARQPEFGSRFLARRQHYRGDTFCTASTG